MTSAVNFTIHCDWYCNCLVKQTLIWLHNMKCLLALSISNKLLALLFQLSLLYLSNNNINCQIKLNRELLLWTNATKVLMRDFVIKSFVNKLSKRLQLCYVIFCYVMLIIQSERIWQFYDYNHQIFNLDGFSSANE